MASRDFDERIFSSGRVTDEVVITSNSKIAHRPLEGVERPEPACAGADAHPGWRRVDPDVVPNRRLCQRPECWGPSRESYPVPNQPESSFTYHDSASGDGQEWALPKPPEEASTDELWEYANRELAIRSVAKYRRAVYKAFETVDSAVVTGEGEAQAILSLLMVMSEAQDDMEAVLTGFDF